MTNQPGISSNTRDAETSESIRILPINLASRRLVEPQSHETKISLFFRVAGQVVGVIDIHPVDIGF